MADGYTIEVLSDNGQWQDPPRVVELDGKDIVWSDVEKAFEGFRGCIVRVTNHFNGSKQRWEITPQPFVFNFGLVR